LTNRASAAGRLRLRASERAEATRGIGFGVRLPAEGAFTAADSLCAQAWRIVRLLLWFAQEELRSMGKSNQVSLTQR